MPRKDVAFKPGRVVKPRESSRLSVRDLYTIVEGPAENGLMIIQRLSAYDGMPMGNLIIAAVVDFE